LTGPLPDGFPGLLDRLAVPAALCRAVLLGRATVTMAVAGVGLGLVHDPWRVVAVLALVAGTTAGQVIVLTRWPAVVRRPLATLTVDLALMVGVLVLSRGGVAYFCYAAGFAALAGVLLGTRALPLWGVQTVLGLVVSVNLLRATRTAQDIAAFVVAFPLTGPVCGIGAAAIATALARYVELSIAATAAAQRSAAASERARLARELHDSVAKTLRGVSFAALALPTSLRRHPALAEQLATAVSDGANAAAREARDLVAGLRLDAPDRDFPWTIKEICHAWAGSAGIAVTVIAVPVEPPVPVRYEVTRILHEALRNVDRHANARHVEIELTVTAGHLELSVYDDGRGFVVPTDLSALRSGGHFGIVGMSERARAVDGTLWIDSASGQGTALTVRVPCAAAEWSARDQQRLGLGLGP
jgi:signal transduction histidine kinase